MLVTVGKHVPPPAGVASPVYWGNETRLRELFPNVKQLTTRRRDFMFRYESFEHFLDTFRTFYGPTYKAFGALDSQGQARMADDLRALVEQFRSPIQTKSLVVPAEYLEVVIER
jgi:hypothetical protein